MTSGEKKLLQVIHKKELKIYSIFRKICNKHNLRYYAIQGTTLGAIFWSGFIPWDDDMDIGMPIDDYEKFVKIAKKELPKGISLLDTPWSGCKIHDEKTTFIEVVDIPNTTKWHGIFIDIVPLIAVPDDKKQKKIFFDEMHEYHVESIKKERYPKSCTTSKRQLNKWRKDLTHRYEYGTTELITDFSFGYYYSFRTEGFNNPIEKPFENKKIFISSTYDFDLKSRYGKYKKHPSKNNVYSHLNNTVVDVKTSYKNYLKRYNRLPSWIKEAFIKASESEGVYYSSFQWLKHENEKLTEELKNILGSPEYKFGKITLFLPRKIVGIFRKS